MARTIVVHSVHDRTEGHFLATFKGIGSVTVAAAQRAAGQPHKGRGQTCGTSLTLQGVKDFGNTQFRHKIFGLKIIIQVGACLAGHTTGAAGRSFKQLAGADIFT